MFAGLCRECLSEIAALHMIEFVRRLLGLAPFPPVFWSEHHQHHF